MFKDDLVNTICNFLSEIGLRVESASIPENCFLPGIQVSAGGLLVDEEKLKYPGDLLHEAGHLAVVSKDKRMRLNHNVSQNAGDEIAAIAWSWAALKQLDLEPDILFHPNGYKGQSQWLIETFSQNSGLGLPLLQWMDLAWREDEARELGQPLYPNMKRWLRE